VEDWQRLAVIVLTFLPTIYEAWTDRKGETKRDKRKDAVLLVGLSALLTGVAYLVLVSWVAVPLFILMWRITTFDYIVNAFLKRYSKGHKNINIWKYSGTTAFTDRIIGKIPWGLRLGIRGLVLSLALYILSYT